MRPQLLAADAMLNAASTRNPTCRGQIAYRVPCWGQMAYRMAPMHAVDAAAFIYPGKEQSSLYLFLNLGLVTPIWLSHNHVNSFHSL